MEAPRRGVSGLLSWDVGVLLNVYFFKFFFTRLHRVVEFFFALAFVHSTLMGFQRFSTIRQIFFSFVGRLRIGCSRSVQRVKYRRGAIPSILTGRMRVGRNGIDEIKISKQKNRFEDVRL